MILGELEIHYYEFLKGASYLAQTKHSSLISWKMNKQTQEDNLQQHSDSFGQRLSFKSIAVDLKIQDKDTNGNYLGYPIKYILMFSK